MYIWGFIKSHLWKHQNLGIYEFAYKNPERTMIMGATSVEISLKEYIQNTL